MDTLSPLSYKLLSVPTTHSVYTVVIIFGYYHYLHQRGFDRKRAQVPPPPPFLRLQKKYFYSMKVKNSNKLWVVENTEILAWTRHDHWLSYMNVQWIYFADFISKAFPFSRRLKGFHAIMYAEGWRGVRTVGLFYCLVLLYLIYFYTLLLSLR